jgi:endonuclease-3
MSNNRRPAATTAKESPEERRSRAARVIRVLKRAYPHANIALRHDNPLQLLVATILSAQCTDVRVNMVTPALFQRYRTARDFASSGQKELESYIISTGFFRAKAKNIIGCTSALVSRHNGKVPDTMEELVALPGVGRKTANVVLGAAFQKAEGIVVDTHVKRLSGRIGLTTNHDPVKIERDLISLVPKKEWIVLPHLLILHGRSVCPARTPKCAECPIVDFCPTGSKLLTTKA